MGLSGMARIEYKGFSIKPLMFMDGGQEEVTTSSKDNSDRRFEVLSCLHVQGEKRRLLLKMNDQWSLGPEEE
jgi:hypothetical protein